MDCEKLTFRAFADYGYEGSGVSARKVHPTPGAQAATIDTTWTRDQLGRLTSIQTNQTFQETLDWTAREELKGIEYPHIQSGGSFPQKWDWYLRDGYSRLVQAKHGVPPEDYQAWDFGQGGTSGLSAGPWTLLTTGTTRTRIREAAGR